MKTNDLKEILSAEECQPPTLMKLVGVGGCGRRIVERRFFWEPHLSIVIDDDPQLLEPETVDDNPQSYSCGGPVERNYIEKDDPALHEKLQAIVGDNVHMLIIVTGLGREYSAPIVSALCRQRRLAGNGVTLVFAVYPFLFERKGKKAEADLAMIEKEATKVFLRHNGDLRWYNEDAVTDYKIRVENRINFAIDSINEMISRNWFSYVDYNDIVALLQSGDKAEYIHCWGSGRCRVHKAVKSLIESIKWAEKKYGPLKSIFLGIPISNISESDEYKIIIKKQKTIVQALYDYFGDDIWILCKVYLSYNERVDKDDLKITALTTYSSNRQANE